MDIEAFALTRPKAPEMITLDPSDVEADGGASIKDTETKPFQVIMRSYLQQAKGDVIRLYLNDEFIDDETVIDEQATTSIFVRPGMFQKGLNRLKFHIERTSGNNEFTPELILLHRTSPPGGTPPALTLSVSHDSIGPGDANNVSVTVTYKNIQWYDRIFVDCNGARVQHQLLPDSTTPLPAAPKNIVIPIPRAALEQGGNDENFEFKFRVVDYLTNPSGPPTWSDGVSVNVHLDRLSLPMAVLREILSDNNDDPAIVDLEKMNGGPLWAQVHLAETVWKSGDSIHLTFTAERAGAVVGTYEQTFENREPGTNLTWEIPNAKVIANSIVKVVYELIRDGRLIASSHAAVATVSSAGNIKLMPPKLVGAVSPIDVLAHPDGVKMRIDNPGAQEGDRARLVELNAPAGTPQFPLEVFNNNKRVNVSLSASYLAARQGKELEYRWNLNRGGGQAGKSPAVKVSVGRIVDGDERLPIPAIAQASGSPVMQVVDLATFEGNATVSILRWSPIETGQRVWIKGVGTKHDDTQTEFYVAKSEVVLSSEIISGLSKTLPRAHLESLKVETKLRIEVSVTMDGSSDTRSVVGFPVATFEIRNTPSILHENFDDHITQLIVVGQKITIPSMTITFLSGSGSMGIIPSGSTHINYNKQVLRFSTDNRGDAQFVRLDLMSNYSKVSFWHAGVAHSATATFYNAENLLGKVVLGNSSATSPKLIEFSKTGITRIEIQSNTNDSFGIDQFSFEK